MIEIKVCTSVISNDILSDHGGYSIIAKKEPKKSSTFDGILMRDVCNLGALLLLIDP